MLSWNGLMVPSGTPAAEVERLHAAIAEAMAAPEIEAELSGLGAAVQVTGPAEFGAALADDIAAWARIVRSVGLAGSA
jgi:tripartite-type tricarboxylate transporter receptor subunit TctC